MNARDRRRARRDNKRRRKAAAKSKAIERRLLPSRPAPSFARLLQDAWSQASTPYGTEAGRSLLANMPPEKIP